MSIQTQIVDAGLIRDTVNGSMAQPDLVSSQRTVAEQITGGHKASILVDARAFEGCEANGDWGDLSGQLAMDPLIHKMAIVSDPKWEDLATAFTGKGLRSFPVEIFVPSEYHKALAWMSVA